MHGPIKSRKILPLSATLSCLEISQLDWGAAGGYCRGQIRRGQQFPESQGTTSQEKIWCDEGSVGDPHVFEPPGSVSQRYGSGSGSFLFLIKVLSGLKIICPLVSYKKKLNILHPKSHWRKVSDPELDPDPLVRGTDPRNRFRTKLSRIPNAGFMYWIKEENVSSDPSEK